MPYFHLVFTLPHGLNPLICQNRRVLYTLLFEAASQRLLTFGQNRFGAQVGTTAVLHTWGQTLIDHYHRHCVVAGGGVAGVWRGPARQGGGTLRRVRTSRVWSPGAAIAPWRQRFGRACAVIFLLLSLRSEGYFPP